MTIHKHKWIKSGPDSRLPGTWYYKCAYCNIEQEYGNGQIRDDWSDPVYPDKTISIDPTCWGDAVEEEMAAIYDKYMDRKPWWRRRIHWQEVKSMVFEMRQMALSWEKWYKKPDWVEQNERIAQSITDRAIVYKGMTLYELAKAYDRLEEKRKLALDFATRYLD